MLSFFGGPSVFEDLVRRRTAVPGCVRWIALVVIPETADVHACRIGARRSVGGNWPEPEI